MLSTSKIKADVAEVAAFILETKNYLHTIPELGGEEIKTSAFAKAECEKLGLTPVAITKTAFYAVLDTGKPGKTVVYRADMDALNMDEDPCDKAGNKKEFVSGHEGWCHSCGHDAHVATLLGAMKVLVKNKDELPGGKVMFLFEAGEENGASAAECVEMLKREKPDVFWSLHYMTPTKAGEISLNAGARTAGFGGIDFTVKGRGGHSSRPDLSVNPVIAMAAIITALQATVALSADPSEIGVLSTCAVNGGGPAHNIIPDESRLLASMRFFKREVGENMYAFVNGVIESTAAAYGCTVSYGPNHIISSVPVIVAEEWSKAAKEALAKVNPDMDVDAPPLSGSETLGVQYEVVPGAFALVGAGPENPADRAMHHNRNFAIVDTVMTPACELSVQYIVDVLSK